jgi:rhodanese-related sulfurtransferase
MQIPGIKVEELADPLPEGTVLLDVREPVEWEHGHIEGAVNVPLMQLPARLEELPEGHLVVVCAVGGRSGQAVAWLAVQGREATNLEGGMVEWVAAGRPIVSAVTDTPHVL